jgi:hypothetical protein
VPSGIVQIDITTRSGAQEVAVNIKLVDFHVVRK